MRRSTKKSVTATPIMRRLMLRRPAGHSPIGLTIRATRTARSRPRPDAERVEVPSLQAERSSPALTKRGQKLDCSHGECVCQGRAVTFLFDCGHLFVPTTGCAG